MQRFHVRFPSSDVLSKWKVRQHWAAAMFCAATSPFLALPGTPVAPAVLRRSVMPSVGLFAQLVFLYPAHFAHCCYCLDSLSFEVLAGRLTGRLLWESRSAGDWNSLLNDLAPSNPSSCWWTWSQLMMHNSKNVTSLLENFQWLPRTVAS